MPELTQTVGRSIEVTVRLVDNESGATLNDPTISLRWVFDRATCGGPHWLGRGVRRAVAALSRDIEARPTYYNYERAYLEAMSEKGEG